MDFLLVIRFPPKGHVDRVDGEVKMSLWDRLAAAHGPPSPEARLINEINK